MADRESSRANNFGALRLLFAYLVIVSHSSELLDGNRSREPLTQVFGTLSFGGLAVFGFFLVSGYLITKSFETSRTGADYLWKRVLRIYPGYVVAFMISLFVVGPLAGGDIWRAGAFVWLKNLKHLLFLQGPDLPGVFAGSYYPALNGSLWTIPYEFHCYLLVLIVGGLGGLSKRWAIATATLALLTLSMVLPESLIHWAASFEGIVGGLYENVSFVAVFGCGACFYLFRDQIRFDARLAAAAGLLVSVLMFSEPFAMPALAVFGGYILFWFAFSVRWRRLSSIGGRVDLSYGVYLYAFPIQKMLVLVHSSISPWTVSGLTFVISSAFAWASWSLVEKPALTLRALAATRWRRPPGREPWSSLTLATNSLAENDPSESLDK